MAHGQCKKCKYYSETHGEFSEEVKCKHHINLDKSYAYWIYALTRGKDCFDLNHRGQCDLWERKKSFWENFLQ